MYLHQHIFFIQIFKLEWELVWMNIDSLQYGIADFGDTSLQYGIQIRMRTTSISMNIDSLQ